MATSGDFLMAMDRDLVANAVIDGW